MQVCRIIGLVDRWRDLHRCWGKVRKNKRIVKENRTTKTQRREMREKRREGDTEDGVPIPVMRNLQPPHPISHISHPALHRFPLCELRDTFASLRLYFTSEEDRKGREGTAKDAKKYFMSPPDILCDLCDTFASLRLYFTGEEDRKGRKGFAEYAKGCSMFLISPVQGAFSPLRYSSGYRRSVQRPVRERRAAPLRRCDAWP